MKFQDYLNEKTSQKEFNDALKNRNINAGCEFEFYLDDDKRTGFSIDTREIDRLVRDSDRQIQRADDNINDYNDAMGDAQTEYVEAEEKRDELEEKKSDLELELEVMDSEQMDIDDSGSDEYYDLQDRMDDIQNQISDIRNEISDEEEIIRSWESDEDQESLWARYEPGVSLRDLSSFKDLMDEMEEYGFYSDMTDDEINQKLFDIFESGEEYTNSDMLWNELFGHYLDNLIDDIQNNSGGDVDEEYIINDLKYPCTTDNTWEIKPDGSLDDGGIEIATGIEQVSDLVEIIDDTFEWIEEVGYTDNSCGFHVHMSMDTKHEIDPLKLLLFMEEGRILQDFQERIGNTYAQSIKKGHFDKLSPFNKDDIVTLMKKSKLDKDMNTEKYLGIHLIDLEDNHVEFRYMGGKDYHKKFKETKAVVGNYAHWLSIACDPNYKKKEYIQKVNRMVNYFNYLYIFNYLKVYTTTSKNFPMLELNVSLSKWKKLLDIELKPFRQTLKSLPKPKSVKNTKSSISSASAIRAVDDFKDFLKKKFGFTKKFTVLPF